MLSARLLEAEKRNLALYGFGIKGFTLSMIETAIEVTEGRVPAAVIAEILAAGREMLRHPVETLPHVRETLESLAGDYRIVLITKGDLFDQERKLAESGLGELFDRGRDRHAEGRRHLCPHLRRARRRRREEHDGGQLAPLRHRAGDRGRELGGLSSPTRSPGWSSMTRRRSTRRATGSSTISASWSRSSARSPSAACLTGGRRGGTLTPPLRESAP